jgi:hypothetical protein
VKGKSVPVDVISVDQGKDRVYSILGINWSILSEIDKDSEKYRSVMGGFRFTFTGINYYF